MAHILVSHRPSNFARPALDGECLFQQSVDFIQSKIEDANTISTPGLFWLYIIRIDTINTDTQNLARKDQSLASLWKCIIVKVHLLIHPKFYILLTTHLNKYIMLRSIWSLQHCESASLNTPYWVLRFMTCFAPPRPGGVKLPEELPWKERYCRPNMIWKESRREYNSPRDSGFVWVVINDNGGL